MAMMLAPLSILADAFDALDEEAPAWSEIYCLHGGYFWQQSRTHLRPDLSERIRRC
jgi:hypothetical protein